MDEYISNKLDEFNDNGHCVKEKLVQFSEEAEDICKYIEIIVTNKVINSSEIAMFDSNAETIVAGLFKAYYNNPTTRAAAQSAQPPPNTAQNPEAPIPEPKICSHAGLGAAELIFSSRSRASARSTLSLAIS